MGLDHGAGETQPGKRSDYRHLSSTRDWDSHPPGTQSPKPAGPPLPQPPAAPTSSGSVRALLGGQASGHILQFPFCTGPLQFFLVVGFCIFYSLTIASVGPLEEEWRDRRTRSTESPSSQRTGIYSKTGGGSSP